MYKRLLLLNGLAIFAVVCNHAAGQGQMGLFYLADLYRPVVSPDWTQIGSISHYFLLFIRQITTFSVPSFFFISGFFVSYAALDKRNPINLAYSYMRIKTLFIPYFIWSIILIGADLIKGDYHSPYEYTILIVTTGLTAPYWFIPALCYSYFISPILVRLAQWNWKLILIISALIQLIPVAIGWLRYLGIDLPWTAVVYKFSPVWSPFQWIFFFTFGISAGFNIQSLMQGLLKYRVILFFLVFLTGLLNILESDYLLRLTLGQLAVYYGTITYNLYATTFILWFLTLTVIPFSKYLFPLGISSYGIYLLHFPIMALIAWIVRNYFPQLLAYPIVIVSLSILFGLTLPLIFMNAIRRSPAKKYYRYLFG